MIYEMSIKSQCDSNVSLNFDKHKVKMSFAGEKGLLLQVGQEMNATNILLTKQTC